ncbi:MAG: hypothetical protein H6669_15700 [Ardenticatenaceae bacterium]|nr:hypothetical protein [Ardenticatenaceae bacterium]
MHDKIFPILTVVRITGNTVFKSYAEELGLDVAQFDLCRAENKYETHSGRHQSGP